MSGENLLFGCFCLMVVGYMTQGKTTSLTRLEKTDAAVPVLQECNVCHNAAPCHVTPYEEMNCECYQGTLGVHCERSIIFPAKFIKTKATYGMAYIRNSTSSGPNNIALNKSVVHCESEAQGMNLANSSVWKKDVCYNLATVNVMIVDLGGIYGVEYVTIATLGSTGPTPKNVSVSLGWHLGGGCSVTDETHCADYVWMGGLKVAPCNATVTGRYLRIQNNEQEDSVICIHQVTGVPVVQYIEQAKFSSISYDSGPAVSPFKDFSCISKLNCATWCLQDPTCLNFRWTNGKCLLYGGPPAGNGPVIAYRYQGNV